MTLDRAITEERSPRNEATLDRARRAQELEESERLKKELRLQFSTSSAKVVWAESKECKYHRYFRFVLLARSRLYRR